MLNQSAATAKSLGEISVDLRICRWVLRVFSDENSQKTIRENRLKHIKVLLAQNAASASRLRILREKKAKAPDFPANPGRPAVGRWGFS